MYSIFMFIEDYYVILYSYILLWCCVGVIKIRDLPSGKCVKEFGSINVDQGELSEPAATPPGYTQLLYHNELDGITAVTVNHNIIIYGLPELETKKQVMMYNELYHVVRMFSLEKFGGHNVQLAAVVHHVSK